jgi:hypothetical protein
MRIATASGRFVRSLRRLAIRDWSWLPRNVWERNEAENSACRFRVHSSSWRFCSLSELQIAFHSSYCVTESTPLSATNSG